MRRSLLVWALFGHAAISELSQLSGVKRELDFESAKGCFWRKAAARFECDRRDDAVAIIFMNMIDKSMRL